VDVARDSDFRRGVVTADAALRAGATRDRLRGALLRCSQWRGARTASRVVAFADGRAESVGESLTRVRMAEDGLPEPELQQTLRDGRGVVGRVDFLFRRYFTVVEFDGMVKYKVPEGVTGADAAAILVAEKLREDRIRALGYEVVRLTWPDIQVADRTGTAVRAGFVRALSRREAP
jgi:hypothetical protein